MPRGLQRNSVASAFSKDCLGSDDEENTAENDDDQGNDGSSTMETENTEDNGENSEQKEEDSAVENGLKEDE